MTIASPSVVLKIGDTLIAVDSLWVTEMIQVPALTPLAGAPAHVRGVCDRRGRVLLLVDLREALGLPSLREENEALAAMLTEREEDHRRWLSELEGCVREGRRFCMALDPHACAFGRWYDAYQAPNLVLESQLRKFASPHQAIHALGAEVLRLAELGSRDEALKLIETSRASTMDRLVELFAEARRLVVGETREIAVAHDAGERLFGFVVDAVERVESLAAETIQPIEGIQLSADGLITRTARLARDERLVLLLDAERLAERTLPADAA